MSRAQFHTPWGAMLLQGESCTTTLPREDPELPQPRALFAAVAIARQAAILLTMRPGVDLEVRVLRAWRDRCRWPVRVHAVPRSVSPMLRRWPGTPGWSPGPHRSAPHVLLRDLRNQDRRDCAESKRWVATRSDFLRQACCSPSTGGQRVLHCRNIIDYASYSRAILLVAAQHFWLIQIDGRPLGVKGKRHWRRTIQFAISTPSCR